MKRKSLSILAIVLFFCTVWSQQQEPQAYDAPDQVVWHAKSRTWFVSNLGGGISLEKDNNGWITRTDEFGKIIAPFWIGKKEGMHAPSGMVVTKKYLYAVDRDGVYKIDIKKEKVAQFYPIPDGEFLNDIAIADNGDLYVSDFFSNKIFKINASTQKVETWLYSNRLEAPDGLYIEGSDLIVASWGMLSQPGSFKTSKLGDLLSINLETKAITPLVKMVGNLEGITKIGKCFFITDWASGKLLKVHPEKETVINFMHGLKHPTDPCYAKELNILAFPQHGTNQVLFLKIQE